MDILARMKKKACDTIRYARNTGKYNELLKSLGLEMVDGKVVNPRVKVYGPSAAPEVTIIPNEVDMPIDAPPESFVNENDCETFLSYSEADTADEEKQPSMTDEEWASQFAFNDLIGRVRISAMFKKPERSDDERTDD
jgi:hypothetical protein